MQQNIRWLGGLSAG